jgi:L-histidine N-alpha-methyltransferase
VPDALHLTIHPSQFPDVERAALMDGLTNRRVDPRLLYQSPRQSARWLAVFERWAPFVNREGCRAIYRRSSERAAEDLAGDVAVIALGCGDGSKDMQLLEELDRAGANLQFVPLDVSTSLVTRASLAARRFVSSERIHPIVADLVRAGDLRDWLDARLPSVGGRIFTFFGMIPNFEPLEILPVLANLLRPGDRLLFSANLAPGNDLDESVNQILPQYDNPETREWLLTLLEENGVAANSGELKFSVEPGSELDELRRIVARFHFAKDTTLNTGGTAFRYPAGTELRLFFSYRYSVQQIEALLNRFRTRPLNSWITDDGEEGVFLCGAET